jgi:amino acid transporter
MQDEAGVEGLGYRQELKRSLSLPDLLVYGLVFIGPIAPVAVFGIVFDASHGMVPLTYLVGLVAMIFTALSYMAMARAFPVAGSVYAYSAGSFGETVGFFAGWAILLDYLLLPTLSNVVCAIAVAAMVPEIPLWLVVAALLVFTTTINYLGIETTAKANVFLLILSLIVLAAFLAIGTYAAVIGVGGAHASVTPFYNAAEISPGIILGAASLGVLSFLGFDAISTLSEEAAGGPRAIAKATIVSLCIAAALFVAQTWLASLFVLGQTRFPSPEAAATAFYDISFLVGGPWLKFMVAVPGIVLGATAGSLTAQAATARLIFAMARDGKLPRGLAHIHPRRKVPERAVFLVAAINLILGLTLVSSLELLTSMVCFGALVGFVMVNLSVIAHFRRDPARSWFRHILAPLFGVCITGFVLWNTDVNAKLAGLAWLAAGAVFYLVLRMTGRPTDVPEGA